MTTCSNRNFQSIVCSVLIMTGVLIFVYKTLPPNMLIMSQGKEDPSTLKPQHQLSEDNWKETIENKMAVLKKYLETLWCQTNAVQFNGGFCITKDAMYNYHLDPMLCSAVESLVGNGSVGDLGAGMGGYGMCLLREKGFFFVNSPWKTKFLDNYKKTMGAKYDTAKVVASWDGFDGAGNVEELSGGFVRQSDLSEENLWLGRQWDWVISVEVGEHVPANKEKAFLDNIVRHACKGVLLSWAVEGQGGNGHVNERGNDYIRAKMLERGLVNDSEEDNRIREQLVLHWLKNTVMVFRFPEEKKCLLQ